VDLTLDLPETTSGYKVCDVNLYRIEAAAEDVQAIAAAILGTLPEWFGRPDALAEYVAATARLPTFIAFAKQGVPVGFVTLEQHTEVATEIHVIGVTRRERGLGCGRQLIRQAEEHLRHGGTRWLTVKTLASSHPDPNYAKLGVSTKQSVSSRSRFFTTYGERILPA
jgi:GNAT superfamily N-acetyltransferase